MSLLDSIFGRGGRRSRRKSDIQLDMLETNRKKKEAELRMIEDLYKSDDPEEREMALTMLSSRARDAVVAKRRQRENDPMLALMQQVVTDKINRDPMDDILRLAEVGKALRRVPGFGDGEDDDSTVSRILNSSTMAELGRSLGESLPRLLATNGGRPPHPEALPPQARVAPATSPADDDEHPFTPENVLALLDGEDMTTAAAQLVEWSQAIPDDESTEIDGLIRGLVENGDKAILVKIAYLARVGPEEWKPVCLWLLEHDAERQQLAAALRAIFFPPDADADAGAADGEE